MSSIQVSELGENVTIRIRGDFTFEINHTFRESYKAFPKSKCFHVDLSETNYIDSAGLGMLVQLREYAGGNSACVSIVGANTVVLSILSVANFQKLFKM